MKKKAHLFDVDNTVVRKTTAGYFVKAAIRHGVVRFSQVRRLPFDWIKYKMGFPDIDFIENTVKNLSGIKKSDLENIAELCFHKNIKQNIYKGASELIIKLVKNGERVIFATSSFDFIIKPLENYFGIEGSLAAKMEYADGKTSGNIDGYSLFGGKKKTASADWMEKNSIRPEDVYFYSDSYTDIPLLEYCGYPVAVNPDRALKKRAEKSGWEILRFKEVLGK